MLPPDQTQSASSAPAFPSYILQLADTYQLGKPLAEYHPKYTPARAMLRGVGKVVLALAVSIAIMVIIIVGVTQMAQSPSSLVIILPIGLALTALVLPFRVGRAASADYRRAVEHQGICVYLCTDGIVRIEQLQGTAPIIIALRWDKILTITQLMAKKGRKPRVISYFIKGRNGQTIIVDQGLANFAELAEKVAASANPILSAYVRSKYEAGEKVVFGPITVNQQEITVRQGLTSRTVALPWPQVAEAGLERNFVVIKQSGQSKPTVWQRIETGSVPNVTIFQEIVHSRIKAQPPCRKAVGSR
jgi:hypothetical protein